MKIFAIETSNDQALLAVLHKNRLEIEVSLPGGPQLSKTLALDAKKIFEKYPPPYDRIVLGIGPGSFTGIRVGAALAQSLAFGWGIPLYTTCSLTAFAPAQEGPFAIVVDARSGGFYVQENFHPPKLIPPSEAAAALQKIPLIASPHPARIQNRLPDLVTQWIETRPNPFLLAQHATLSTGPLELVYLGASCETRFPAQIR